LKIEFNGIISNNTQLSVKNDYIFIRYFEQKYSKIELHKYINRIILNILITSAGRRVSLLNAFRSELIKIFPDGKMLASDLNPDLAPACHVADQSFKVPKLSDDHYIPELLQICLDNSVKLIIPTIDTELLLLAENAALFSDNGVHVLISSVEFMKTCRNKRDVHEFFELNDINVAEEFMKHDFKLPMFIKPLDGSGGADTSAILSEDQVLERHVLDNNLMFLEYFDKKEYDEYTCDLYYDKSGILKCSAIRKRLEVRDGEVSKAITERNSLEAFIKDRLRYIKGARGCITLQLFKHKVTSEVTGIEINPRFGGGYPLSYLAGANYPKWIIDEYLFGRSIEDHFGSWEKDVLLLRYDNEIIIHGYKG